MAKQPFTPDGAAAKIAELYALPDPALLIQADLIRSDYRGWIEDNFLLDASQVTYLAGVDDVFIAYIAQQLGMAVQNRLDVTLETPLASSARISKWLTSESTLSADYDGAGGVIATGALHFKITYA